MNKKFFTIFAMIMMSFMLCKAFINCHTKIKLENMIASVSIEVADVENDESLAEAYKQNFSCSTEHWNSVLTNVSFVNGNRLMESVEDFLFQTGTLLENPILLVSNSGFHKTFRIVGVSYDSNGSMILKACEPFRVGKIPDIQLNTVQVNPIYLHGADLTELQDVCSYGCLYRFGTHLVATKFGKLSSTFELSSFEMKNWKTKSQLFVSDNLRSFISDNGLELLGGSSSDDKVEWFCLNRAGAIRVIVPNLEFDSGFQMID